MKPVALVTGTVSPYRREPFRLLAETEGVEVIAWRDAGEAIAGLTVHATDQLGAARHISQRRYRAVIAGLGGRIALPAIYAEARRARIPFVLWTSIWSHPRTPAHALSLLPTRFIYRRADAVVTYGPHVSDHVKRQRRRGNVFEAPQAVSAEQFGAPVPDDRRREWRERAGVGDDGFLALFVGRLEEEKGVQVLLDAWRRAQLGDAALALAGDGPLRPPAGWLGQVPRDELPALYAAADVLVVPSIQTATFTEPWGLVVNEAMHQGRPVIATDAVGAAAGGLVRDGRNGLVVPQDDPAALATALRQVASDTSLRERLGDAARHDVEPYSEEAWVAGMRRALAAVGAGR
jgi:glycosyltransferase involved in cell wall biosynthesis